MRFFVILLSLLFGISTLRAERIDIPLSPDSTAMLYYFPAKEPNGIGIIACPGGAYANHAMNHEGFDFAKWFNDQGFNYAVLKYRLPNGIHEIPAEDGFKAISIMRGMTPKVGIMGFSAGGHLASTLATHYPDSISRPDFQILFYPVISMDVDKTHSYSREKLLGNNPSEELVKKYSNELQVSDCTPPALILHSADDDLVPLVNSLDYCCSLSAHKVPVTMVVFPSGGHGWGFSDNFIFKRNWMNVLNEWLTHINKIN